MILAFLALAWLLGIAAASFTGADPAATLAAGGLLAVVSFALRPRLGTIALIAAGSVLVFAAGWRYESTSPEPSSIARFNDGAAVRLRGVVSDEPEEQGAARQYRLSVRESFSDGSWHPDSGGVLMRASPFPAYEYGDLLEIRGDLENPPVFEDFDYRDYLFRQGMDSIATYPEILVLDHGHGSPIRAGLIDVRSALTDSLSGVLPDPEAALASGILFGTRSDIPEDLNEDMQATGTSHLVAVSGQNVVLLAALLMGSLAWIIGRRPAVWIALGGVIGYAALVGAQPSVVRAAIMGGLYVVAIAIGRRNTALVAIAFAAAVMTAASPQIVHDVSFQLSFAATLGLVLLTPLLAEFFEGLASRSRAVAEFPLTRMLNDVATMTLAAIAFTLPVLAISFHRVSLAAPVANLFAVPAFVAVAATSGVAAVAGLVLPGGAGYLSWLAWPPAAYLIAVVQLFADVPVASVELRGVHVEHAIAYYALLGAAIWWCSRRPLQRLEPPTAVAAPHARRLVPAGALAVVLLLSSALLWLAASRPENGRLTVAFLDVGQGDAILIEGPEGHRILVDGGPSGEAITAALGRQLPFYDRRLDLVALTHPQQDHIGGLPAVLEEYSVGRVLSGPVVGETAAYQAWSQAVDRRDIPAMSTQRGQTIDLGGGAALAVLSPGLGDVTGPENMNDTSIVLRLTMGDLSFLLTGDITEAGETALIRTGADLDSSVLKIAHHGSLTSTSPSFVRRTTPLVDVISVGADNSYGHPTDEVLSRLEGDLILRTDLHGDIMLSTDGQRLWVQTQRGTPASVSAR
jgi:competence protein ComEC